jgi:hypothetical protein
VFNGSYSSRSIGAIYCTPSIIASEAARELLAHDEAVSRHVPLPGAAGPRLDRGFQLGRPPFEFPYPFVRLGDVLDVTAHHLPVGVWNDLFPPVDPPRVPIGRDHARFQFGGLAVREGPLDGSFEGGRVGSQTAGSSST